MGHVLLLTPMFELNLAALKRKTKILAIFLWSFHYFEKGGFWGPPFENFQIFQKTPLGIHPSNVHTKFQVPPTISLGSAMYQS